ncbi:hypothetical protein [Staphylococcus saprophyticus]|uniref:hypothetical protein n=1 Tax=Staphylococcus saprophyticus TaxID=29385 RepID=UPI001642A3CB|nr:hypothetical protein [Staphylococcus saprophyticus]
MVYRIDKTPERIEELKQAINALRIEDREVYGYESEYRIAESNTGLYIELIPQSDKPH